MKTFNHEDYLSPLTWRYGSDPMRRVWSEAARRRLMRRVWVALARAQEKAGLVRADQAADLAAHADDIDIERADAIESEIHHDVMAEIRVFAAQCPVGGPVLHLGATSTDILDNVDALRMRQSLDVIIAKLKQILGGLAGSIDKESGRVCIAYTHLQSAEPTTVGYRLAQHGQDLLADLGEVSRVRADIRGKGLKGAVGTGAGYGQLLAGTSWTSEQLERAFLDELGIDAFAVTTQTYPRKQEYRVAAALAGLAGSIHKLAFDVRILQSTPFGEWSEPFGAHQVGSSAMPFKRNPISSENIDSLTRVVAALSRVTWDNAALTLLERTLDDSAARRMVLPEMFILIDEILGRADKILKGLRIVPEAIERNLQDYGIFAATERVMMEAVKAGGDRQVIHETIRRHSIDAWNEIQSGRPNPLAAKLAADPVITAHVKPAALQKILDVSSYVGDAPVRARKMSETIRRTL